VKEDGISCHSPALRGLGYCHFHLRYKGHRLRTWRNRQHLGGWHFTKRSMNSQYTIAANLKRVEMALAGGCSDPGRVRLIGYGLRQAAANLRYMEATKAAKTAPQPNSGKPQSRTGAHVKPDNSIFCDKSFGMNYVPRNSRQVIDSTGAQGRGTQLTSLNAARTLLRGKAAVQNGLGRLTLQ
jgi:hypothetical protein